MDSDDTTGASIEEYDSHAIVNTVITSQFNVVVSTTSKTDIRCSESEE
jgi:hypothetical protein